MGQFAMVIGRYPDLDLAILGNVAAAQVEQAGPSQSRDQNDRDTTNDEPARIAGRRLGINRRDRR
jgi:hypothetical protein